MEANIDEITNPLNDHYYVSVPPKHEQRFVRIAPKIDNHYVAPPKLDHHYISITAPKSDHHYISIASQKKDDPCHVSIAPAEVDEACSVDNDCSELSDDAEQNITKKRKRNSDKKQKLMDLAQETLTRFSKRASNNEDQFDIAGKMIAIDLRQLDDKQRIICDKIINDVIYYGKLGLLNEFSTVNVDFSNEQSSPNDENLT